MIKAVIVDFDDTLCMTEQACFDLENEILRRMGRSPMSREIHKTTWGQPLFETIKVRSPGVDAEEFRRLTDIVQAEWVQEEKIDVVDNLRLATLDALAEAGKKLYVLTSRTHQELRHLLAPDHGLASRITAFYYRDIMEFHKPDPRAFDLLLKDHAFERAECAYVGDSPNDAIAAKQAGMHFIGSVESGVRTEADFEGLLTDVFITHFTDLPAAVAQLDQRFGLLRPVAQAAKTRLNNANG